MEHIRSFIMDRWYRILNIYESLKRAIAYGKIGYGSYDWDHEYLLDLMNFKMVRMYDVFLKEEIFSNPKKEFKSLRICIKLYQKRTYSKNINSVYKRWGDPEMELHGNFASIVYKRARTPELKKILSREIAAAYNADERKRAKYEELYFKILHKYHRKWWS